MISTFALKKKPDATRFEDLRIISIMPTPWRMIEDTLIDALAEKIKDAVNKSETYQYGFFKGHTISQSRERKRDGHKKIKRPFYSTCGKRTTQSR